jgi:hypothetical protein
MVPLGSVKSIFILVQGERVESLPCVHAVACPEEVSTSTLSSSTAVAPPAPTSPCSCGCTYILHGQEDRVAARELTTRHIDVTSGRSH